MSKYTKEQISRHIKTHSARSDEDRAAVTVLETYLRSGGRINSNFASGDKWPNTDGTFELVPEPDKSKQPTQNFCVQIKGTGQCDETADYIKYRLKSLAFPAFVCNAVTFDPCILFVVLNPCERGKERVFWKYMSPRFLDQIDFSLDSTSIQLTAKDEIFNTDESVVGFAARLSEIAEKHRFASKLDIEEFTKADVIRLIQNCDQQITEAIDKFYILNETRDNISCRILNRLQDLCTAALMLNAISKGVQSPTQRIGWELALEDIRTKFLSTFFQRLRYVGKRIPQEGQTERLMLTYYDFLWQIRQYCREFHNIAVLGNLEQFPLSVDEEDRVYYESVADAIERVYVPTDAANSSRYYIQKVTQFYVGKERYFEITLQLSGIYATKFDRLTVYSKSFIPTNYPVEIGFREGKIKLWGESSSIKVVTAWKVSIDPSVLNKFAACLGYELKISSIYGEYGALMAYLSRTGMNLLDLIDMKQERFERILDEIYSTAKTSYFKEVLCKVNQSFSSQSKISGRYVIRYALIGLREEVIADIGLRSNDKRFHNVDLTINNRCGPFDRNPLLYDLPRHTISVGDAVRVVGAQKAGVNCAYMQIQAQVESTGEIYIDPDWDIEASVEEHNYSLNDWDRSKGKQILKTDGFYYIEDYETTTLTILRGLLNYAKSGNEGQKKLNGAFLKKTEFSDQSKREAIEKAFTCSKALLVYGAAGTGKTTLINYLSNLMEGRKKLFLAKTHTAVENLQRRVDSPGGTSIFCTIDKYVKAKENGDDPCDVVFVDECSIIDNRTMMELLKKVPQSLLVLVGDVYQIESIRFGNWFLYAKDIMPDSAVVELNNNWRTDNENIKRLWDAVRYKRPNIADILVVDGPFSENINQSLFQRSDPDEIVLCLNYDGRFGLNNINRFFQDANRRSEPFTWREWSYKVGDPVLFKDNKRFPRLYNNLKGVIVDIHKDNASITFVVDVQIALTEIDSYANEFTPLEYFDDATRIEFTVYENTGGANEDERQVARIRSIVPFQVAYAVSIHKSQGLEYDSVKLVIPGSNSETISHGTFYTAITRAKKKLKIYWSSETMCQVIGGFEAESGKRNSLEIIRKKLGQID